MRMEGKFMRFTINTATVGVLVLLLCFYSFPHETHGEAAPPAFTILQNSSDSISIEYKAQNPYFENELKAVIDSLPDNQSFILPAGFVHRKIIEIPERTKVHLEVLSMQGASFSHETAAHMQKMSNRYTVSAPRNEGGPVTLKEGYLRNKRIAVVEVAPLLCYEGAQIETYAESITFKLFLTPDKTPARACRAFQSARPVSSESETDAVMLKITVKEKGIYKVTHSDVQDAGINTANLDPTGFQLMNQGSTVSILVEGENDHSFDTGDYFIFYGQPVESDMTHQKADNKFVLENIYWLDFSGTAPERMKTVQSQVPGSQAVRSFSQTVREQQDRIMRSDHIDSYLWANFPDYEDTERSDPLQKTFTVSLSGVDTTAPAALCVRFKGENSTTADPDHRMRITLNGTVQGDADFDAFNYYLFEATVSAGVLQEGANQINIKNNSIAEDLVRLDWIEITYPRYFIAENNQLLFQLEGGSRQTVKLDGFSSASVLLFNVADPCNVQQISGYSPAQSGSAYSVTFAAQNDNTTSYYAAAADAIKSPESIVAAEESQIKSSANQADYLIITHEDFYDAVQPLASYRKEQGYTVKIVKTGQIYDAFNYGIMHPQAIRDFLEYAFQYWQPPAPHYVLLVGDGNSDATDRLATGNRNFIPIRLDTIGPQGGTGPNDTWYSLVNGDDILSDFVIGRIPVKTADQLTMIIDRIIDYETSPKSSWMRKAFFIAGDDPYFVLINEQLAKGNLPSFYTASFFNRGENTDIDSIFDTINDGTAMTVYTGHGNITSWNGIMDTSKLTSLQPNNKPTLLVTLDCYNGHFSNPANEGFAEEFLRSEGGSICGIAPVATGYPYEHKAIASNFFNILFNDNNTTIGEAFEAGKLQAYLDGFISVDAYQQYILLGDPATMFNRCDLYLISPENRSSISRSTPFTWRADGFARFEIQFSSGPSFATGKTFSFITNKNPYSPGPLVWSILGFMAQNNDLIWWRIGGVDRDITISNDWVIDFNRNEYFTEPRSFTIKK